MPLGWRVWARSVVTPKVDYMATIRHAVRKALRDSTLGRYDRTYRRPHRRQAAYGEFIMSSFHQPRPRPGFLIDTSSSMQDSQLSRAVAELAGLTRQLGYSTRSSSPAAMSPCTASARSSRRRSWSCTAAAVPTSARASAGLSNGAVRSDRPARDRDRLPDPWPEEAPPFPVIDDSRRRRPAAARGAIAARTR